MKIRSLVLTVIAFFITINSINSQFWLQSGGSTTIDEGMSIAVDGDNNIYTTGYYTSTFSMSGSQVTSAGFEDIFITKMNAAGHKSWLIRDGGSNQDRPLSIDADAMGNIVITGYFYGTTTFGATTLISQGQQDIFIAKYDSSGTLLWAVQAGGSSSDIGNAVKFDQSGNVIVTGEFSGTCFFGANAIVSHMGTIDAFIAKYDTNGSLTWVKKGSGNFVDRGTGITTDSLNNIYVYGMFSDSILFDIVYPNSMQNSVFLLKLSPGGSDQWFRWLGSGSSVNAGGLNYSQNGINITGSFSGSLLFFGVPGSPALSPPTTNNIFLARFSTTGSLEFYVSEGSYNPLNSIAIASAPSGKIFITGNFKCQFTDFSNHYGDGIFRSMGFWDTYVASYDNTGNWLWARHYAGKQNDVVHALAVYNDSLPVITGSYDLDYCVPMRYNQFTPHGTVNVDYFLQNFYPTINFCSDSNYGWHAFYQSKGNSDVFINAAVDVMRQPLDYFKRSSGPCNRVVKPMCISNISGICVDTMFTCFIANLYFYPGVGQGAAYNFNLAPLFNINWSSGATSGNLNTAAPGMHIAVASTIDGCFTDSDSLYLVASYQPLPMISDNKGVNSNSIAPAPLSLCAPDSVELICTNPGTSEVEWIGFPVGMNPIVVSTSGTYTCILTNPIGCSNSTEIEIEIIDSLSTTVLPALRWLDDIDGNDSIQICMNEIFEILVYDEFSNPGGLLSQCIPEMSIANWDIGGLDSAFNYDSFTHCSPLFNKFFATAPGSYELVITVQVVRANPCSSDTLYVTDTLYVEVLPAFNGILNFNILGPDTICPGDSTILVAFPPTNNYVWNLGIGNDSLVVSDPGTYSVTGNLVTINSYGCIEMLFGSASHTLGHFPQPFINTTPSSGIICPNDSILLECTGTAPANWYGPSGSIVSGTGSVYITIPGNYYCIQTVSPGCQLLSNTVTLNQYSSPAILAFPDTVCYNGTTTLSVIASAGSLIQWQPPLSGSSPFQNVTAPGTYQCEVTSCGILSTLSITINNYPPVPQPVISVNPPELISTPASSYQWLLDGVAIPGANGQTYVPTIIGNYTVIVTDLNGCTSESDPFIFTNLYELLSTGNIYIVPNPATTGIQIIIPDRVADLASARVSIRDLHGKIVLNIPYVENEFLNINEYANGVYVIELKSESVLYRKKFIIYR